MLARTLQSLGCLFVVAALVCPVNAQVQPDTKDLTALSPDSGIAKMIKAMIDAEDAKRRIEMRQQIRAELLFEFEAKRKLELEIRDTILKELQDTAKRDEDLKKKILEELENAAKQQNDFRKLLTEQILRELQAGGGPVPSGPGAAPLASPGQTRVQILGTVGRGAGQGGVIMDVDGEMRTLSVGDTFVSGGATYRIASVTSEGVSIVAEKAVVQR